MGVFDFNDPNEVYRVPDVPVARKNTPRTEALGAFLDYSTMDNSTLNADIFETQSRSERLEAYEAAVGYRKSEGLLDFFTSYNPWDKLHEDVAKQFPEVKDLKPYGAAPQGGRFYYDEKTKSYIGFEEKMDPYVDKYIEMMRIKDPKKFKDVKTSKEIFEDIAEQKRIAKMQAEEKMATAPKDLLQQIGYVGAGALSVGVDPENILTGMMSGPTRVGIVGKMALGAVENMAGEMLSYPALSEWREKLGEEYSNEDFMTNLKYAAIFGAALPALGKTVELNYKAMRKFAVDPMIDRYGDNFSRAVGWSNLKERFKKLGFGDAADEAAFLQRVNQVREGDVSGGVVNRIDGQAALKEVDAALKERRGLKAERLPDSEKMLEDGIAGKIKDPFLRNQYQKIVELWNKADGTPEIKKTEPLLGDNKMNPVDANVHQSPQVEAAANQALKEQRLLKDMEDLETMWKNNPNYKHVVGDRELDVEGFKKELRDIDNLAKAVSTCSGGLDG